MLARHHSEFLARIFGIAFGVELTEEYIPIAEARIKYWLEQKAEEDNKPKQESLL